MCAFNQWLLCHCINQEASHKMKNEKLVEILHNPFLILFNFYLVNIQTSYIHMYNAGFNVGNHLFVPVMFYEVFHHVRRNWRQLIVEYVRLQAFQKYPFSYHVCTEFVVNCSKQNVSVRMKKKTKTNLIVFLKLSSILSRGTEDKEYSIKENRILCFRYFWLFDISVVSISDLLNHNRLSFIKDFYFFILCW